MFEHTDHLVIISDDVSLGNDDVFMYMQIKITFITLCIRYRVYSVCFYLEY